MTLQKAQKIITNFFRNKDYFLYSQQLNNDILKHKQTILHNYFLKSDYDYRLIQLKSNSNKIQ